jgi:hypothetical protein
MLSSGKLGLLASVLTAGAHAPKLCSPNLLHREVCCQLIRSSALDFQKRRFHLRVRTEESTNIFALSRNKRGVFTSSLLELVIKASLRSVKLKIRFAVVQEKGFLLARIYFLL